MEIWVTADQHFGHQSSTDPKSGIIHFCNRPFDNIKQHDECLLELWNKNVQKNDIVYFVGDLSFHPDWYLDKLNGKIFFIMGNHDKRQAPWYSKYRNVIKVCDRLCTGIGSEYVVFEHFAMRVWPRSHFNSWHCYAHSHGRLPGQGKSMDVGVDSAFRVVGDYRPFNWEEVKDYLTNAPDNFNLVKKAR